MKSAAAIGVLACSLASLVLSAQQPPRPGGAGLAERFKQIDRNGDGKVSAQEFPGPQFKQMDTNGDGFVTLEEAQTFYAGRQAGRRAGPQQRSTPLAAGQLTAVDAVFELCVRDVEACVRFYRDGIGMREVEPARVEKGARVEWAGSYLRLRRVAGEKPAPAAGNPMKQMLASNGFRWFSLWFDDPVAIGERLVKAGYPRPLKGANVSLTRDPENNVVEIMGVPRGASTARPKIGAGPRASAIGVRAQASRTRS
jgi:catechol 2,3-dioxygenase-like lactoylglutathione lyase family enzyme